MAQWHSDINGLGDIFYEDQVDSALQAIMKNNYKERIKDIFNHWRVFSVGDESGTIICDYPQNTNRPAIPISYSEETMTGFEYSFAGLLFSRGFINEGLKVVKSVRQRYDGEKRNPWNEMECGSNYARTMSSFAFLPILSGFLFDVPNKTIGFNPKISKNHFRCPWFLESGWGEVIIKDNKVVIDVLDGYIKVNKITLPFINKVNSVLENGIEVDFDFIGGKLIIEEKRYSKLEICYD